jgi:hypothetical protein
MSGYHGLGPIGSYSPSGLTGGKTVYTVLDICYSVATLNVDGFSSNPGSGWLTSITCNGITKTGSTAAYAWGIYGYRPQMAAWSWTTTFGFSDLPAGTNVSCTIVHN